MDEDEARKLVREEYGRLVRGATKAAGECCRGEEQGRAMCCVANYSPEELGSIPDGAELGLGCGNPSALASIKGGETVVDLGSGAGVDCFLAANKVGRDGRVIGVDMTPEMVDAARRKGKADGYENVEFRLGEIENLPIADNTADLVVSNCVINLSPLKQRVFEEAFRILKPGGKMIVSDIVLLGDLPARARRDEKFYVSCIAGAALKQQYLAFIAQAGFQGIDILRERRLSIGDLSHEQAGEGQQERGVPDEEPARITHLIASIDVTAFKPVPQGAANSA